MSTNEPSKKTALKAGARERRWRQYVPPKRLLTFNGLHCVISQKTELFITTGVRTSNPTQVKGKAIPVTGREDPQVCETSRLPHFVQTIG
jgi:hypothetical protein